MKRLSKIIELIEIKTLEVANDNIDFSEDLEDRFCTCSTFVEIGDIIVNFEFDAVDTNMDKIDLQWLKVENVVNSKSKVLPNVTEYLNNYHYTL
jgi:hypothetical protein